MIGDEGLVATDAMWEARARARGRTQILQAQKGRAMARQAQRRNKDAGFSLYPTLRSDSVSEWG